MGRPLRIEYPGAFYHVTSRGNEQKDIFKSEGDREKFLTYLESAAERYGAIFHAYCLMSNHYHLMIETPEGNLSRIMKHINNSYTNYFNVKRKRAGHLLQGRYKAVLVEADAYAAELSRYIHLNPVRAKMVALPEEYKWSSYRFYLENPAPPWLSTGFVLGYFGADPGKQRVHYRDYILEAVGKKSPDLLSGSIASTILGSDDFVRYIKETYLEGLAPDRDIPALRELQGRPDIGKIKAAAGEAFPDSGRLARAAGIYLCHRFSGARLQEIGDLFGLSPSGVTQAGKRFDEALKKDKVLEKKVLEVAPRKLDLPLAQRRTH
ncbi:MAG: Transposase IS200 like protein [Synergistetes bacterium ADurb.Bin155]|nr:MAG: Transposase IS200 like protein [Synergistetes bacterium ADurb.Bin155]